MTEYGATEEVADVVVSDKEMAWVSPVGLEQSRKELVDMLADYESVDDSYRIGDVGCGDGQLMAAVAETYPDATVVGTDISSESVAAARDRTAAYDNVSVYCDAADAVLTQLDDFDAVYAVNMLQDTANPVDMMGTLYQNVVEEGTLIATVPSESDGDLFGTAINEHSGIELPYTQSDWDVDGETVHWQQYVFPEEQFEQICDEIGWKIQETDRLVADAAGLPRLIEVMDKLDRSEEAEQLAVQQQEDPSVGPEVDMYVLER
jgi:cyclopropane fatty-acyl-phospholipid synthase-like methyltransferase